MSANLRWCGTLCLLVVANTALPSAYAQYRTQVPTGFVRQLSKDKPRVYLVSNSPAAAAIASSFRDQLLKHKDNKHKPEDIILCNPVEASALPDSDPKFASGTRIFFLTRSEGSAPLPASLQSLCPIKLELEDKDTASRMKADCLNPKAGSLSFSIALSAIDSERLQRLTDRLTGRTYTDYTAMTSGLTEAFLSYQIMRFSDEDRRDIAEKWGSVNNIGIWAKEEWHTLDERLKLPAEKLKGWHQAYFIDRSRPADIAAAQALHLHDGLKVKDTTVLANKIDADRNAQIVVFSAPNANLLGGQATEFASLEKLPSGVTSEELKDFRHIGKTALFVIGEGPTDEDREAIRVDTARKVKEATSIGIADSVELGRLQSDVTLDSLKADGGVSMRLQQRYKVHYVWLARMLDYTGGTIYNSENKVIREDVFQTYEDAHPRDPEPTEPEHIIGESQATRNRINTEHTLWEILHGVWLGKKAAFEKREQERMTAQYSRNITRTISGSARCILQLVKLGDATHAAEVVWELETNGAATSGAQNYKSDSVTVRLGETPDALPAPANTDECPPELKRAAATDSVLRGINNLAGHALLPNGSEPEPTVKPVPENGGFANKEGDDNTVGTGLPQGGDKPAPLPAGNGPVVADVSDKRIVIVRDADTDIQVGDRVQVVLRTREIKNPTTGEVIRTEILESVIFKVIAVDSKTADCYPVSAAEAKKIGAVKKGVRVKTWRPAAAK